MGGRGLMPRRGSVGTGGSGRVYLADDVNLRRRVAVKVLHPAFADDEGFLRRFRAEAQIAASLFIVRWTLEELGIDSFEPGDVVLHNDPYRGGALVFHNASDEGQTTLQYDMQWRTASVGTFKAGVQHQAQRARFDVSQPQGVPNAFSTDSTRVSSVSFSSISSASAASRLK